MGSAWPEDALLGILLSAVVGITATALLNIYLTEQGTLQIAGALIVFFMTFLPRAILFLPLAALVRWVIGEWSREPQDASFSITRMALSLLLVVVTDYVVIVNYENGVRFGCVFTPPTQNAICRAY